VERQKKQNKIVTVIGHKGDGKTVLTELLTVANDKPAIIADPRGQYPTECRRRLSFKNPRQLKLWIYDSTNFKEFYRYKLELICSVDDENFQELAQLVYQMRSVNFVVDEVDMFFSAAATNKNYLYKIVHYGRHNLIDIISTSRRPANISRNLTSQTDIFYFSKLNEPADIKYFKNICGDKYLNAVQNLPKYSFLEVKENGNISMIRTTENEIRLIDKL
jgi:hypothetical protein